MSEEEKLKIEQECLLKYSKAKMIEKYINTLEENQQLKDNWNKLKEQLKEIDNFQREFNDIPNTRMTPYDAILEIIQELEGSDK